jgi:hypothetical protein
MNFRTILPPIIYPIRISHTDGVLLLGSCFSENIGTRLQQMKFKCAVNPFGVIFHPAAIEKLIIWTMNDKVIGPDDIMENNGNFFQFMFHTRFNAVLPENVIDSANLALANTKDFIKHCKYVIITPGTAYAYHFAENDEIVSNCHKVPARFFTKKLYNKEELQASFESIRKSILSLNPQANFVFTLSPVRHIKDGMIENNLSKSRLLDAIHLMVEAHDDCLYFPAYELMMDDLRDYRFYADDMLHPSDAAVNYIWDYLSENLFSENTKQLNKSIFQLQKSCQHRPFNTRTSEYKVFLQKIITDCNELARQHPYLDFSEERRMINQ